MIEGLLAARQYFNGASEDEKTIVTKITTLWEEVEWDWYTRGGMDVLYWHWSPTYDWQMNMQIRGWNEAAIVYLLAIASPTFSVDASLWNTGWAGMSDYLNGTRFYGILLRVGWDWGGPLFFTHYSFLGFDPRDISDGYANYFDNNRNTALIHHAYAINNPRARTGYGDDCWGLTASDDPDGYKVHEPTSGGDNGTITPTAALSSFPYTPEESMRALKHFYRDLGDKTWNWMGFYDAFNQGRNWWATSYLAIDQGPIIIMIENYRTQLLWNLFMSNPEIQPMLDSIGFFSAPNNIEQAICKTGMEIWPNPCESHGILNFRLNGETSVNMEIFSLEGRKQATIYYGKLLQAGYYQIVLNGYDLLPGIYILSINKGNKQPEYFELILQ
jgi:hypothetical protein